jgi:glycosyltransferase involved in cell wall biosynthesis
VPLSRRALIAGVHEPLLHAKDLTMTEEPLVSVVTPVYNGAEFLATCIESVMSQTFKHCEYIIVNNCSTDDTLDIAQKYAQLDRRISVYNNDKFVGVIDNHNNAFGLMSPAAKYCKVVSADDFIFDDCVRQLVQVAEANPSVGLVGCYQLSGSSVLWQGFEYPRAVIPGVEMCRRVFLRHDRAFGFGTPTSLLYRADLIRATKAFYPNASPHADTSACFQALQKTDFGFAYQLLSYCRTHDETQSSRSAEMNRYVSGYLNDIKEYGRFYLSNEEYQKRLTEVLDGYHRYLAVNWLVGFRDKEFWAYHKSRLAELGYPLKRVTLISAAARTALQEILSPEQAFQKLRKRAFQRC